MGAAAQCRRVGVGGGGMEGDGVGCLGRGGLSKVWSLDCGDASIEHLAPGCLGRRSVRQKPLETIRRR